MLGWRLREEKETRIGNTKRDIQKKESYEARERQTQLERNTKSAIKAANQERDRRQIQMLKCILKP